MGYSRNMLGMVWKIKERKWGLGRGSRKGSDIQTNIYITYISIICIIFIKHILRHVKQHKGPAL